MIMYLELQYVLFDINYLNYVGNEKECSMRLNFRKIRVQMVNIKWFKEWMSLLIFLNNLLIVYIFLNGIG